MVLRKQREGAGTCRFSVDLQNGKTIRIPLIWYKRKTRVILGVEIYDKEGINLSRLYFHDNEISVPILILQHLNNSGLAKNGIAPIKRRYSNTMQETYLSNGCFHCDAIQGQFFLWREWVESCYTESGNQ